jgi:hypothetical protein
LRDAAWAMISRSRCDWRECVDEDAEISLELPTLDAAEVDLRISSARHDWSLLLRVMSEEASAGTLARSEEEGEAEEEERKASLEEPVKVRKGETPADSLMGFEST